MQQVLLDAAASAGAEVRRGVHVTGLSPGRRPTVSVDETDGGRTELAARIVIAADGRDSAMRRLAGFAERRDPAGSVVAGVMVAGLNAPDENLTLRQDPGIGQLSVIAPLGDDRHRLYFCYDRRGPGPAGPLTGDRSWDDFRAACVGVGVPQEWFEGSSIAGPLASFDGADTWVEDPYRNGVALLGDAAAASDPAFGCGLSLTLRGVRLLRDRLLATDDWDAAGRRYASEQQIQAASLRRITNWLTRLWFEPGQAADDLRAQALPRLGEDPTRMPDFVGLGCDAPSDENARRRLFGED
jgi:2-polyprenyl-6-methoxyphenol hydroxylase-like FAD-dependent oxidoreductase